MDGTLLDHYSNDYNKVTIVARPYLSYFFKYLFDNYDNVSIWTNGSLEWYSHCYREILSSYIPDNKSFDFVVTFDDNLISCKLTSPKKLQIIYDIHSKYNETNTILIDDSKHTLTCDLKNSILIPSYICYPELYFDEDEIDDDEELLNIVNILKVSNRI